MMTLKDDCQTLFCLSIHCLLPFALVFENLKEKTLKKAPICTHIAHSVCWLMSMTHSPKPCLCSDTKHGSQQCTAQPSPLIYHVNFSNSPCSPCWPDNPCRQLQTILTDREGNGSWGSAQCVSGYDTPANHMEIPQYAPAKRNLDVISLSGLQSTYQITDPVPVSAFYWIVDFFLFFFFYIICCNRYI